MSVVKQMLSDLAQRETKVFPSARMGTLRSFFYRWQSLEVLSLSLLLLAAFLSMFVRHYLHQVAQVEKHMIVAPVSQVLPHSQISALPSFPIWHSSLAQIDFPNVTLVDAPTVASDNMSDNTTPAAYLQQAEPGFTTSNTMDVSNANLADVTYAAAKDAFDAGDEATAISKLREALRQYPDHKSARILLVKWLLTHQETGAAQQILQTGLNLSPSYAPFAEMLARIDLQQDNATGALAVLKSAHPPVADNPDYYAFMAELETQADQAVNAIKLYTELLQLDEHHGSWWVGLGIALEQAQNNKDAIEAYTQASQQADLSTTLQDYVKSRLAVLNG
jgi:Flp pilus assembly protein TadD